MTVQSRSRRVLIADDDRDILKVLSATLEAEGFDVEAASNGADALAMAQCSRPDLVVLDVLMPGLNGRDVMSALRSSSETKQIPVILLSALSSDDDIWEGWRAGASYYLTKPFDTEELVHFVRYLFGQGWS